MRYFGRSSKGGRTAKTGNKHNPFRLPREFLSGFPDSGLLERKRRGAERSKKWVLA